MARRAFTIIELVVCVAVIGLLLALSLPAIQSVRETARRSQCQNHLRQIGLALHNYHEMKQCFPVGNYANTAMLLPFLDQGDLYLQFDAEYPTSVNWAQFKKLPIFLCPSDGESASGPFGRLNYATNIGSGWTLHKFNGFYNKLEPLRLSDLTDGASQTVAMSETLVTGSNQLERLRASWFVFPGMFATAQWPTFLSTCEQLPEATVHLSRQVRGFRWFEADFYDHAATPQKRRCHNGGPGGSMLFEMAGVQPAVSGHSMGVHALMADSAVRFVQKSVDGRVWEALGSRNAADVVSSDF